MTTTSAPAAASAAFVPLRMAHRPLAVQAVAVLLGTLVMAAASWIEVPMIPVPMTMQTYAIVIIGALYGWRLGAATMIAYLGEAMIGLPVLAGGASGPVHFVGPTAGYLFAYPLAAGLVGWLAEQGWTGGNLVRSFAAVLAGHVVIFAGGLWWLAVQIGGDQAVAVGLLPFLFSSLLQMVLAVATVEAARRTYRRASPTARR